MVTWTMVGAAWTALGKYYTEEEAREFARDLNTLIAEVATDMEIRARESATDRPLTSDELLTIIARANQRAWEEVLEEYLNAPVREYLMRKEELQMAALEAEAERRWELEERLRWEEDDESDERSAAENGQDQPGEATDKPSTT